MDESGPAGVPSDFPHQNRPLFDEFRMKRRLESTLDVDDEAWLSLEYLSGFHNHCATEAL